MKILTLIGVGFVAHYCYKNMKSKIKSKKIDVIFPESKNIHNE